MMIRQSDRNRSRNRSSAIEPASQGEAKFEEFTGESENEMVFGLDSAVYWGEDGKLPLLQQA